MGHYAKGQVCLAGHEITGDISMGGAVPFCAECGNKTITCCPSCKGSIRGYYVGDFASSLIWEVPAHCIHCGTPFPWTAAKLNAVTELAEAIEELTNHERQQLAELMPHLITESARTQPAGFKVAAILTRLKGPARETFRSLLNDIAVDAGRAALGL